MRNCCWASTVLLRILDLAFAVFVDLEIKSEFSANTYRSSISFFAWHKLPLLDGFDGLGGGEAIEEAGPEPDGCQHGATVCKNLG